MTAGLELRDLACRRGNRLLFRQVSSTVRAGELLRVQGANGAGKTSLLRMICGLASPAAGQVLWHGRPVGGLREEYGRELAYLGHAPALKDELSALENLEAAATFGGRRTSTAEAKAALDAAGLNGREHLPARVLSQGQRRRAGLARLALPSAAALWVLDEPFNALDTHATQWLLDLLSAQLARGGIVVLTSHQPVALDPQWPQVTVSL